MKCSTEEMVLVAVGRKELGVELTVTLAGCVNREATLKAGYQGCIGVLLDERRDGRGLPVAGTTKNWSYWTHPSALQGLIGSRAFPARASSQL